MLDHASLAKALLAAGSPLWLHDASGASSLDHALRTKAFRVLPFLLSAAASDPATAAVFLGHRQGPEVLAGIVALGDSRTGPLGGFMRALTLKPFGEVCSHAAVRSFAVCGLWSEWPLLLPHHSFPPRTNSGDDDGPRNGQWRRLFASLTSSRSVVDVLCETRCVALPELARSRALLHVVTTSEDDTFIESVVIRSLVSIKWSSYALPVLTAQAALHAATFVAFHISPTSLGTRVLLVLLLLRQLLLLAAQAAHEVRMGGVSALLPSVILRLRTLLTCCFVACLLLTLLDIDSPISSDPSDDDDDDDDDALDANHAYRITLSSLTRLFFWLRFVYFLRLIGTLSALLSMLERILLDVRPFALLFVFAMGAATDTLYALDLLRDLPWTLLRVYSVAGFGGDLPNEFAPVDRPYHWWAIAVFFAFSFVGSVVMMNFIIAVMGDTFERVQERAHVLAIKERALLVQDVDSCLPSSVLRSLNPRFVLYSRPVRSAGSLKREHTEWTGFFGEIKREIAYVRADVTEQLAEQRHALTELRKLILSKPK